MAANGENVKETILNKDGTITRAGKELNDSKAHTKCIGMVEKSCIKGILIL